MKVNCSKYRGVQLYFLLLNVVVPLLAISGSSTIPREKNFKYDCVSVRTNQNLAEILKKLFGFYLPLALVTYGVMILSFGSRDTKKVWEGERVKSLPNEVQEVGRRKLRMLNAAQTLQDLRIPPSNNLEKLRGS